MDSHVPTEGRANTLLAVSAAVWTTAITYMARYFNEQTHLKTRQTIFSRPSANREHIHSGYRP